MSRSKSENNADSSSKLSNSKDDFSKNFACRTKTLGHFIVEYMTKNEKNYSHNMDPEQLGENCLFCMVQALESYLTHQDCSIRSRATDVLGQAIRLAHGFGQLSSCDHFRDNAELYKSFEKRIWRSNLARRNLLEFLLSRMKDYDTIESVIHALHVLLIQIDEVCSFSERQGRGWLRLTDVSSILVRIASETRLEYSRLRLRRQIYDLFRKFFLLGYFSDEAHAEIVGDIHQSHVSENGMIEIPFLDIGESSFSLNVSSQIVACDIAEYFKQLSPLVHPATFVPKFLKCVDGERDPFNVVTLFHLFERVNRIIAFWKNQSGDDALDMDFFDSFSCYFPIDFKKPQENVTSREDEPTKSTNGDENTFQSISSPLEFYSITRPTLPVVDSIKLQESLRELLIHPRFIKISIPFLLEKLSSAIEDTKLQVLEVMRDIFVQAMRTDQYFEALSHLDSDAMSTEDTSLLLLSEIIQALREELHQCIGSERNALKFETLRVIKAIGSFVYERSKSDKTLNYLTKRFVLEPFFRNVTKFHVDRDFTTDDDFNRNITVLNQSEIHALSIDLALIESFLESKSRLILFCYAQIDAVLQSHHKEGRIIRSSLQNNSFGERERLMHLRRVEYATEIYANLLSMVRSAVYASPTDLCQYFRNVISFIHCIFASECPTLSRNLMSNGAKCVIVLASFLDSQKFLEAPSCRALANNEPVSTDIEALSVTLETQVNLSDNTFVRVQGDTSHLFMSCSLRLILTKLFVIVCSFYFTVADVPSASAVLSSLTHGWITPQSSLLVNILVPMWLRVYFSSDHCTREGIAESEHSHDAQSNSMLFNSTKREKREANFPPVSIALVSEVFSSDPYKEGILHGLLSIVQLDVSYARNALSATTQFPTFNFIRIVSELLPLTAKGCPPHLLNHLLKATQKVLDVYRQGSYAKWGEAPGSTRIMENSLEPDSNPVPSTENITAALFSCIQAISSSVRTKSQSISLEKFLCLAHAFCATNICSANRLLSEVGEPLFRERKDSGYSDSHDTNMWIKLLSLVLRSGQRLASLESQTSIQHGEVTLYINSSCVENLSFVMTECSDIIPQNREDVLLLTSIVPSLLCVELCAALETVKDKNALGVYVRRKIDFPSSWFSSSGDPSHCDRQFMSLSTAIHASVAKAFFMHNCGSVGNEILDIVLENLTRLIVSSKFDKCEDVIQGLTIACSRHDAWLHHCHGIRLSDSECQEQLNTFLYEVLRRLLNLYATFAGRKHEISNHFPGMLLFVCLLASELGPSQWKAQSTLLFDGLLYFLRSCLLSPKSSVLSGDRKTHIPRCEATSDAPQGALKHEITKAQLERSCLGILQELLNELPFQHIEENLTNLISVLLFSCQHSKLDSKSVMSSIEMDSRINSFRSLTLLADLLSTKSVNNSSEAWREVEHSLTVNKDGKEIVDEKIEPPHLCDQTLSLRDLVLRETERFLFDMKRPVRREVQLCRHKWFLREELENSF